MTGRAQEQDEEMPGRQRQVGLYYHNDDMRAPRSRYKQCGRRDGGVRSTLPPVINSLSLRLVFQLSKGRKKREVVYNNRLKGAHTASQKQLSNYSKGGGGGKNLPKETK